MSESAAEAIRTAQAELRARAMHAAAVRAGAIWPLGTLCRWGGVKSKTVFVVVGARPRGDETGGWSMQLHPVGGSHLVRDVWTDMEYLRRETHVTLEDREELGTWRGWCSCRFTTNPQRGRGAERRAQKLLDAHAATCTVRG